MSAPSLTFILIGVALGPYATGILRPDLLLRMDVVVSVALAALGVFIGLGLASFRMRGQAPLLLAALVEVALTFLVVSVALYLLLTRWAMPLSTGPWLFASVLGICASASAAVHAPGKGTAGRVGRLVDLDDAPLVALATLAVGVAGGAPLLQGVVIAVVAGLGVGLAGWLLFERAQGEAERGVFVAGAIALLGGVGAYGGTSPLLCGAVAAIVWKRASGGADRIIRADLGKLQHPLVALLLIVAGASVRFDLALAWVAIPLVLLRLTGKLIASTVAARLCVVPPGLLATVLLPPGVLGVAIALNVQQVLGVGDTLLLSAATVMTALSEPLSALLVPREAEAST